MSPVDPRRIVVVAALREEAAYVAPHHELVITGIGKTAAAVAVTRAIVSHSAAGVAPEDLLVVNLGTAGALRDGIHGLHEIGTVINTDMNADVIKSLGTDPHERQVIDAALPTVLASGDVFVTEPATRDRLAEQASLVDMEGYAVAYACRRLGAPLRMAKHVSDSADESAHDWRAAVDGSARELAAWLEEVIRR
ncbi:nucleosidase, partial [Kribbia dieselivorans]|uniref:nucleosidase n=1 Tax=Kribbia dieselivorans TaxID=331526 RepID=UPI001FDFCFF9